MSQKELAKSPGNRIQPFRDSSGRVCQHDQKSIPGGKDNIGRGQFAFNELRGSRENARLDPGPGLAGLFTDLAEPDQFELADIEIAASGQRCLQT